jgi:lysophospholipase L1-like esterase
MVCFIASAFRNSLLLWAIAGVFAQDAAPDTTATRIKTLERTLRDYGGLIRYGSDNSELPAPKPGETRVIFFGDQITDFWGRNGQLFSGKRHDGQLLNRGIAGQTTDQMLIRFRQDVISLTPRVVVILAGLNDIAGLHGSSTEEMIVDNLMSMTELARAHGIRVVLASLTPVCNCYGKSPARERWRERIAETNELIEKYCARSGAVYLDYFSAMAHEGDLKKEFTADGVLPNEAGYGVMARLAEKSIAEALRK